MATLGLDEDELKAIEQTLARVAQLSSSIQSLKLDVLKSNPLPHPSSLQASAQILQRNLQNVLDSLTENADLFSRIAVHPSTNFPGRTQENVLTQLLRKKLEPDVEELVAQGRETARLATPEGVAALQDVWEELREWTHERVARYVREEAGDVYTEEEREMGIDKVRTGLRKGLDEESDEDDEDDDEDEDDDDDDDGEGDDLDEEDYDENGNGAVGERQMNEGPELETLLWFATVGDFNVPPNVEYQRKDKAAVKKGLQGVRLPPESGVQSSS